MSIPNFTPDLGRVLLHAVWQLANGMFFDTKRLKGWKKLKHQFDDDIVDEESALNAIDRLLSTLKDPYTERIVSPATGEANTARAVPADSNTLDITQVISIIRPDGMAYLRIPDFDSDETYERVKAGAEKLAACDGIVVDLRHNTGGRMHDAMALCGLFLRDGVVATLKTREESKVTTRVYALSDTEFFANVESPKGEKHSERFERLQAIFAGKPLVLLIDECTASSAELMTLALVQNGEEGKVCMVGSGPTPGKGIGQAEFSFLGGQVRVRITRLKWFMPSNDWLGDCGQTKKDGIMPDVIVTDKRLVEGTKAAFRELRKMIDAQKTS